MARSGERGQALVATVVVMEIVLVILLSALTYTQLSGRLAARQLIYAGQANNAAEAGLVEALSWFRRQTTQPVASFAPKLDTTVTPNINDTEEPSVGIVRTFEVSDLGRVRGRYEVTYGKTSDWSGTVDVTVPHGKTTASVGSVWQLESTGIIYVQNDSSVDYKTSPNKILARRTARTEIQKMAVKVPAGGAAIFATKGSSVNIGTGSRVIGGKDGVGIAYNDATAVVNGGTVSGTPSAMKASAAGQFDIPSVFGVSKQELTNMADVLVKKVADLPKDLPGMSLIVIDGNAVFDNTRPLQGSGILVVFGDMTIQANNNADYSGVIYCTGNYSQAQPSAISGAVITTGGTVKVTSSGDVSEVDYDKNIIDQIQQQMADYRFSRSPYLVGVK
ncbi:MAG TPA: hypothetical protein VJ276_16350 [Thermoanaerobaculia bacterium]|nr:hypothetical protein [Thermoanaerobaculia bacterium]